MFQIAEYLNQGMALARYCLFRTPALPTLMLYVTNACNSRCKICHLWKIKKHTHLPLESIRTILGSPLVAKSVIGIEGGEIFLHPDWEGILELLSKRGRFILLSNGLATERLLNSVRQFKIPKVSVSLDGMEQSYLNVRGVDGYAAVKQSILSLREYAEVSVAFTFCPWNSVSDFLQIQEFCRCNAINLKINIFHNVPLFEVNEIQKEISGPENLDLGFPEKDYLDLYNGWLNGKVKLPCLSIRFRSVVWPDGSVPLCQCKNIILGNIHSQSIDEIWRSPKTLALWKQYYNCNDCWGAFHRIYDVVLIKAAQKVLPKRVIEKILGEYTLNG
ncbi:radical SAM protein [bacterium]|nr:MAG: radical SAM protein [bacterium]